MVTYKHVTMSKNTIEHLDREEYLEARPTQSKIERSGAAALVVNYKVLLVKRQTH